MAITFQQPQDPYGIVNAGSILANALYNNALNKLQYNQQLDLSDIRNNQMIAQEDRLQARQLGAENRLLDQQRQQSGILAQALQSADLATPQGQQSFLAQYLGSGGDTQTGLAFLQQAQRQNAPLPQTTAEKERDKSLIKYQDDTRKTSANFRQVERELPSLRTAIEQTKDRGLVDRARLVAGKATGFEDQIYKDYEQTISSVVKTALSAAEGSGTRITIPRLRLITAAFPSPEKPYESNLAAYEVMENWVRANANKASILREVQRENPGLDPIDLDQIVEDRLDQILRQGAASQGIELPAGTNQALTGDTDDLNQTEGKSQPSTFSSLPSAKEYPSGQRIRDNQTGKIYVSNGRKWTVAK